MGNIFLHLEGFMKKHLVIAIVLVLGLAINANATIWNLDVSNVNLGISGNFATVDVSVSGHVATFRVDANQALLGSGTNFGIDKFFFNTTLASITASDFSANSGWTANKNTNGTGGFGAFELNYIGKGNSRVDPLFFTITDTSITSAMNFYEANADGHHFVAHIAGFPCKNGQTSAFFTDGNHKVSEPSMMLLFGSGLLGLGLFRFKK
jgi:hypothetical protein